MKKALTVLAVLAMAAAAQAELLATWGISADGQADVDNKNSNLTFGQLVASSDLDSGTFNANGWAIKNWANAGSVLGQLDTTFTLADDCTFTLESITSTLRGGGNPATANFAWYNGTTQVTDVQSLTKSKTDCPAEWTANENAVWTSSGTLTLKPSDAKATGGGNAGSASWTSIKTVNLYGEVTEVPEPATMSLLGLGALALALRRKLRK